MLNIVWEIIEFTTMMVFYISIHSMINIWWRKILIINKYMIKKNKCMVMKTNNKFFPNPIKFVVFLLHEHWQILRRMQKYRHKNVDSLKHDTTKISTHKKIERAVLPLPVRSIPHNFINISFKYFQFIRFQTEFQYRH